MPIDLNYPADFTIDNVRRLIESGDDSANSQLRVSKSGIATLANTFGSNHPKDLAFRIETWIAANGHVGKAASQDNAWVERVYNALRDNWPDPSAECIDLF